MVPIFFFFIYSQTLTCIFFETVYELSPYQEVNLEQGSLPAIVPSYSFKFAGGLNNQKHIPLNKTLSISIGLNHMKTKCLASKSTIKMHSNSIDLLPNYIYVPLPFFNFLMFFILVSIGKRLSKVC